MAVVRNSSGTLHTNYYGAVTFTLPRQPKRRQAESENSESGVRIWLLRDKPASKGLPFRHPFHSNVLILRIGDETSRKIQWFHCMQLFCLGALHAQFPVSAVSHAIDCSRLAIRGFKTSFPQVQVYPFRDLVSHVVSTN
jgi:hypothetical protein